MNSPLRFNAMDFGAYGDGVHHDGAAINAAIAACHAAGGGRVVLPAGTYLTGPIKLCSNLDLHVESGATVLFSRDFNEYPLVVTPYEGRQTVACCSPLWGEGLSNVSITGDGTFDGQGDAWRPIYRFHFSEAEWRAILPKSGVVDEHRGVWWPSQGAMSGEPLARHLRSLPSQPRISDYSKARDYLRPSLVKLVECDNVLFDGPTFQNSPSWNIHIAFCRDVTIRNISVFNPWYATNGDGLDIESSRNVNIHNCTLDVGDDAICLKSGKDAEGRSLNRPCENILITNCFVLRGHGGVVVGSEMSGGIYNVKVWDCVFEGTEVGVRFKTCRGRGGTVKDIDIRNLTMTNIKGAAISFNMFYSGSSWSKTGLLKTPDPLPEPVSEETPQFRNITISNVTCHGAALGVDVCGLPEMHIANIRLENMTIEAHRGIVLRQAKNVSLSNIEVSVEIQPALDSHNVTGLSVSDFNGYASSDSLPIPKKEKKLVLPPSSRMSVSNTVLHH